MSNEITLKTEPLKGAVKELKRVLVTHTPDIVSGLAAMAMLLVELDTLVDDSESDITIELFTNIYKSLKGPKDE